LKKRPGATLPPADFEATAAELQKRLGRQPTRREIVSYLIYPRVLHGFVSHQETFGDTSILPTPVFLYGPQPGEEMSVELEPGKTLIIKLLTVGDPQPDGRRTVFFELNGQPRDVTVRDVSLEEAVARRAKADPGDPKQVGAPMPGMVVNVAIKSGDTVARGQKLLTMEAMKMETTLYAERDGQIAEVLVEPGAQVDTGDLVIRWE
ncbi:MAG TPA: biotin/lipoyl-containing protein, partial [Pirellulales bacterium]|nr:biotin/lipoyl-containing protein [Pirellulales bacterium]